MHISIGITTSESMERVMIKGNTTARAKGKQINNKGNSIQTGPYNVTSPSTFLGFNF